LDGAYERLTEHGYAYGPVFQGLRRVWRGDNEVFAEVALPEGGHAELGRFILHPALFDAALHALLPGVIDDDGQAQLPFAWSGASRRATGTAVRRVRLSVTATEAGSQEVSLTATDETGALVARVESLALRPLSAKALSGATSVVHDNAFRVEWTALPAE